MTTTKFPPQAYTRETLAQAYEWLKIQPANVRELAKSADELVNLYLHARRHRQSSDGSLKSDFPKKADAPVSSETFKKELVDLAKNFAEFEGDKQLDFIEKPAPAAPLSAEAQVKMAVKSAVENEVRTATPPVQPQIELPSQPTPRPSEQPKAEAPTQQPTQASPNLDPKTQLLLQIAADHLNLSSPEEALRLLVVLGFERAKKLFPSNER